MQQEAGKRTLLASVLLSSPGPIVLGVALFFGRSSTQLADFVRRTAELGAIVVSWLVYRTLHKGGEPDFARKERLEQVARVCVGVAMCLSGVGMLFIAFLTDKAQQGNVIPGLVIAILGVITNSWFWLRYHKLNSAQANAVLAVQSKLYRAKSLVDACVVAALLVVAIAPSAPVTPLVDSGGSIVVSLYLIVNGIGTLGSK